MDRGQRAPQPEEPTLDIASLRAQHPDHWKKACAIRVLTLDAVAAANSACVAGTKMRSSARPCMGGSSAVWALVGAVFFIERGRNTDKGKVTGLLPCRGKKTQ